MIYPTYLKGCLCRCAVQSIFLSAFGRGCRPLLAGEGPPAANWRTKTTKTCFSLGDFDPFRHISCLAEGGLACRIRYTGHVFWPSANGLPWRKGGQGANSIWRLTPKQPAFWKG